MQVGNTPGMDGYSRTRFMGNINYLHQGWGAGGIDNAAPKTWILDRNLLLNTLFQESAPVMQAGMDKII